jgi:hypothetical protein
MPKPYPAEFRLCAVALDRKSEAPEMELRNPPIRYAFTLALVGSNAGF